MTTYINLITGREHTVHSIHDIPGNIVNRGLSDNYLAISYYHMEYGRLVNQLQRSIRMGTIANHNTIKGIKDFT